MSIAFPSSPTTGQAAAVNGRTYSWNGSAWDLVANVAGHAASHASGGADALALSASQITSGTLDAARLPATAVLTNDTRLASDGSKGDITVSSNGAAWAINANAVVTADIADAAVTDAKIAAVAASKLTGTLDDGRLSGNVLLAAALAARQHQTASFIDAVDRTFITTAVPPVNNATYWTFFTPAYTVTVSQIAFACTTAASGVTLCRFGIYTADAAGNATLVARTASDTTIFNASNAVFTRSLNTTGGYPATYTLLAGTRYAVSLCIAAANTGSVSGASCPGAIAAQSPRVQGVRTGTNELLTTQGQGQYNGTVGHIYWARLS